MMLSQHYSVSLCVLTFLKVCIYKTLSTVWLVKYKSYCKQVFKEMKTQHQQCCSHVGITRRLKLFCLSSHVTEWPLLCS